MVSRTLKREAGVLLHPRRRQNTACAALTRDAGAPMGIPRSGRGEGEFVAGNRESPGIRTGGQAARGARWRLGRHVPDGHEGWRAAPVFPRPAFGRPGHPGVWVVLGCFLLGGYVPAIARDCNRNGVPDNCDVDCLQPGCTAYPCGRSDDLSPENGIPDECEGAPGSRTYTSTADFTTLGTLINLDEVNGVLSRSQMPKPLPNLWIAASNRGTVVRINTRFRPGDPNDVTDDVPVGAILGEYYTGPEGHGRNPSRTAVNLDGEVWVANRDDGTGASAGSVTRIGVLEGGTLVDPAACEPDGRATYAPPFAYNTCVDRNGDGMITTSNGLGPLPWPFEGQPLELGTVDTAEDECIINYVTLIGRESNHVSIDKNNNLWVGGNWNNIFEQVDGQTGEIIEGDGVYPGTFNVGTGGHGGLIDSDNVLWSASTSGHTGLFRYDTDFGIGDIACCQPDILVDSNNDGVIDGNDNAVEETSALIFPVNSDDDNGNLTPDFEEFGPVYGEDDLQEIQLFVPCYIDAIENPTAWWCLSWNGVECGSISQTDTIRVWRQPDKSDGNETNPGPGEQIYNGSLYDEWPPPATVWLESLDTYDDMDLTFTIFVSDARTQPSDTVQTSSQCTAAPIVLPNKVGRYWVEVKKSGSFTGIQAEITTNSQTPLCGESLTPYKNDAASLVWVAIRGDIGYPLWVQMGYQRQFLNGKSALQVDGVYVELLFGPADADRIVRAIPASMAPGPHTYAVIHDQSNKWNLLYDGVPNESLGFFQGPMFPFPTEAIISSEILNLEDKMVGIAENPCEISSIQVWENYANTNMVIAPGDATYQPPSSPGSAQWGKNESTNNSFEIWDKIPIQ